MKETKHYLCKFEGLVEPRIISGPFNDDIPDKAIIRALKTTSKENDVLFGMTIRDPGVGIGDPKLWSFPGGYMDKMREQAMVKRAEETK
jgi:hypothetical protein